MNPNNQDGTNKAAQTPVVADTIFDDPKDSAEYLSFFFWDRELPTNSLDIPSQNVIYEGYLMNKRSGSEKDLATKYYVLTKDLLAGYAVSSILTRITRY